MIHTTVPEIMRATAAHFGFTVGSLRSADRHRYIADARHISMYLCRKHTRASCPDIGMAHGNRDHATVGAALRKVEALIDDSRSFRRDVEAIEATLALPHVSTLAVTIAETRAALRVT